MNVADIQKALHEQIVKRDQVTELEDVTFPLILTSETEGGRVAIFARYHIGRKGRAKAYDSRMIGGVEAYATDKVEPHIWYRNV